MEPTHERRRDGQILGLKRVVPRTEYVGDAALVNENGLLSGSYDELRCVFYLIAVARKPPDESVLTIINPLDDIDEFRAKLFKEGHLCSFSPEESSRRRESDPAKTRTRR